MCCARIPERSYQESWAISTNAWRILEEVRETWIDDPGAQFENREGEEGEGGGKAEWKVSVPGRGKKNASRSNLYLSSFRTHGHLGARMAACRWMFLIWMHVSVCRHARARRVRRPDVTYTMWKRAVVSLEIIINIGEWRSIFRSPSR